MSLVLQELSYMYQ